MDRLAGRPVAIFHMSSFSRSGETILQRVLGAHRDIEIVHHLALEDSWRDIALARHLRNRKATAMPARHPLLLHRKLGGRSVLLLKNATWTHRHPYKGFILARNPISVCTRVVKSRPNKVRAKRQRRWATGIDPALLADLDDMSPLQAQCELITRKLVAAHETGLPIVHYERFVREPEPILRKLVAHLGLDWDPAVLTSESAYREGEVGHGKNPLWLPVHDGAIDKYLAIDKSLRLDIHRMTKPLFDLYGYTFDDGVVGLRDDAEDRF